MKKENRAIKRKHEGEEEMGKLEIAVLIGAESKEWLTDLDRLVTRLEKAVGTKKVATTATEEAEETTTISAKTVAAKAATKTNGKKAAPAEEEDFDLGQEEEAEEAPAVTKKDLIAACRDNREAAIKVLKKLKVNSVHELKPAQYGKVLAEIGA